MFKKVMISDDIANEFVFQGAWIGFIVSVGVGLWILIGSLRYPTPLTSLPLSTDGCLHDDHIYNATTVMYTYVTELVDNVTIDTPDIQRYMYFFNPCRVR